MANSKISALTSATTPLAGTETLPIVQSSTTKQVSVANLTVGRAVTATSFTASTQTGFVGSSGDTNIASNWIYFKNTAGTTEYGRWTSGGDLTNYNNFIQGTAAKGINFTANTPAAGMTSQLLNWYEEGTWTPTLTPGTSGSITLNTSFNKAAYTRVGRVVTITAEIIVASVSSPVGTSISLSLPIAIGAGTQRSNQISGAISTGTFGVQTLSRYAGAGGTSSIDIIYNAASVTADFRVQFSISYFA